MPFTAISSALLHKRKPRLRNGISRHCHVRRRGALLNSGSRLGVFGGGFLRFVAHAKRGTLRVASACRFPFAFYSTRFQLAPQVDPAVVGTVQRDRSFWGSTPILSSPPQTECGCYVTSKMLSS